MTTWAPQQAEAIDAVGAWLNDPGQQVFRLFGYAGTGKTTLARHLASQQDKPVQFAAYTGKAASVLRRKGCGLASTIHALIYRLQPPQMEKMREVQRKMKGETDPKILASLKTEMHQLNKPKFVLNDDSEILTCGLVIIDEVSMVGAQIGTDLLSFGVKILVLGDPGQLPPVEGAGFFTEAQPDYLLTEVHRQAKESPIITLATWAREGRRLRPGGYGECKVINRADVDAAVYTGVDQVIVGLNRTRKAVNGLMRDSYGYEGGVPEQQEKLICLKNDHKLGLLNGTQWQVHKAVDEGTHYELELFAHDEEPKRNDDGDPVPLVVDCHPFTAELTDMPWFERKNYNEFDFGYAVTCHKSQGSQWPSICVQNESYAFRENSSKWLYTALTRAETHVIVAQ